jgi:hypothetical protein
MLRKTVSYDCTKIDTLKFFKHYQEIPEWHEILHALWEKYIFWFIIFSPYFPCVFHWFWVLTCEMPMISAIADNIGTSPSEQYMYIFPPDTYGAGARRINVYVL